MYTFWVTTIPLPPREQLCNRSCSNKHSHLNSKWRAEPLLRRIVAAGRMVARVRGASTPSSGDQPDVPKFKTDVESQDTIKMTEPSDLDPRLCRITGLQLGPRPLFHGLHVDPGCPTESDPPPQHLISQDVPDVSLLSTCQLTTQAVENRLLRSKSGRSSAPAYL